MHSSTDEPFSRSEKWRLVSGKSLINIRLGGVFSRDGRSSPRRRLSAAFPGGERALDAAPPPPPHCRWKYMETILLTRSSVMWHTHSITAHGENILVWDDVLYGFLLGVESSYSLVISKQCYILSIRYICPFLLKILVGSCAMTLVCMIQIEIIIIIFSWMEIGNCYRLLGEPVGSNGRPSSSFNFFNVWLIKTWCTSNQISDHAAHTDDLVTITYMQFIFRVFSLK